MVFLVAHVGGLEGRLGVHSWHNPHPLRSALLFWSLKGTGPASAPGKPVASRSGDDSTSCSVSVNTGTRVGLDCRVLLGIREGLREGAAFQLVTRRPAFTGLKRAIKGGLS